VVTLVAGFFFFSAPASASSSFADATTRRRVLVGIGDDDDDDDLDDHDDDHPPARRTARGAPHARGGGVAHRAFATAAHLMTARRDAAARSRVRVARRHRDGPSSRASRYRSGSCSY